MNLGVQDLFIFFGLVVFWLVLALCRKGEWRYCVHSISAAAIAVMIGNIIWNLVIR